MEKLLAPVTHHTQRGLEKPAPLSSELVGTLSSTHSILSEHLNKTNQLVGIFITISMACLLPFSVVQLISTLCERQSLSLVLSQPHPSDEKSIEKFSSSSTRALALESFSSLIFSWTSM